MRATVGRALADGIIDAGLGLVIIRVGKDLFYKDRSIATIVRSAAGACTDVARLDFFGSWAARHRMDQKRGDALALLDRIQADRLAEGAGQAAAFTFAHTAAWERASQAASH